ncbi:MAG: hypothetical protein R3223_02620 [Longimicrobiales bacterium]|nr:hypothetical protein [Longimicrobiales bacterium]
MTERAPAIVPPARTVAALVASFVAVGATAAAPAVEGQTWRSVTMSRQLSDESRMDVEVHFGAGRFNVGPSEEGLLYRMEMRYDEELFEPDVEYDPGQLKVDIERTGSAFRLGRDHSGASLDLGLSRDVILDLDLEFGAVRADLELGGLSMSELALATGASESTLRVSEPNPELMRRAVIEAGAARFDAHSLGNLNAERIEVAAGLGEMNLGFGGEWRRDATVEIDMGMGSLDLEFPRGLGVRIEMDSFLASMDPQGLIKDGDVYLSPDWEDADHRITLQIDAALGSVDVSWIP